MLNRRDTLAALALPFVLPGAASASEWPARPVRLVVGWPAGGTADMIYRLIAERLTQSMGQPVVVDNRAGASGTIGADTVAKAPPDGYTLLGAASPELAIVKNTMKSVPYDATHDFEPISLVALSTFMLVASASVPATNLTELIGYAKANPGKLNFASYGPGSSNHLVGELFKTRAGIDITHIPYRGSTPAMNDLLAGQVQLMFDTVPVVMPHVQTQKLKPIALAQKERSILATAVPTFAEAGMSDFIGGSWELLAAPKGTPASVIEAIWKATDQAMRTGMSDVLTARGLVPMRLNPSDSRAFLAQEVRRWAEVAQRAGVRPE